MVVQFGPVGLPEQRARLVAPPSCHDMPQALGLPTFEAGAPGVGLRLARQAALYEERGALLGNMRGLFAIDPDELVQQLDPSARMRVVVSVD